MFDTLQRQSDATFRYLPLDNANSEIRVVKLRHAAANPESQDIFCAVEHVCLDEVQHYVALSYVWGDPTVTSVIFLDGFKVSVTENLYQALLQLRQSAESYTLWIDALCIDQANAAEKGAQIKLMNRIYSQAARVFIWLGLEDEGSNMAMHQLRDMGHAIRELKAKENFANRIQPFVELLLKDGLVKFDEIWKFIRQRPWWQRLWVIQEAVLAREAVVICGNHSAKWDDVLEGLSMFEWMILCCSSDVQFRDIFRVIGDIYTNVSHFELASSQFKSSNGEGLSLLDLLRWVAIGNSVQATDPRDRIYGLLGLLDEEERQNIPVDYLITTTSEDVLRVTARALVGKHGPNVLCYCQHSTSSTSLPSWVPNWTCQIRPTLGGDMPERKYSATGTLKWQPRDMCATYGEPALSLRGIKVGRVAETASGFDANPDGQTFTADCQTWLLEIEKMMLKTCINGEGDGPRVMQNLWRLPTVDTGARGPFSRPSEQDAVDYLHAYKLLTGATSPTPDHPEDLEQWLREATWNYRRLWNVHLRRPFTCKDARFGLGPAHLQTGDILCIFLGGDMPFILRERDDETSKLIGEAYIYGLMDGEATLGSPVVEDILLR